MSHEIRPPAATTPDGAPLSPSLVRSINESLAAIPDRTLAAVVQVPVSENGERVLKGQLFLNVGNGLSFSTWLDHNLDVKSNLGWGVAVRKKF
jgi:hypothetical protein